MIHFEALREDHFRLLNGWFNKPHVQTFYSLHDWTLEEVKSKYMLYVRKEKPVNCFITYLDGTPFAFIQDFAVKDFGWPEQDFTPDMIAKAAGIDLFIGEASMRNVASQRLFHRARFKTHKTIHTRDTLERDGFVREVSLVLMTRRAID